MYVFKIQFVVQNRRAMKEPDEVLNFSLCQLQIYKCTKVDIIILSVAQKSHVLPCLKLRPNQFMIHRHMKQNYFLKKYTSETILDVNVLNVMWFACKTIQYDNFVNTKQWSNYILKSIFSEVKELETRRWDFSIC